jgi:capsular exopolysaccharide synthesis family protein
MKLIEGRITLLQQDIEHQLDLIQEKREARIKYLEQQEAQYGAMKDQLLEDVQAKATINYEYDRLIKEEASLEKYLQDLQRQLLAFDKSAIDESQFTIVQQGIPQASPAMPNRQKIILQGFLFGFILGLGLVYFLHRLDDRLEIAADIEEALQEPVLGQVPQVETKALKGKQILITNLDQYSFFAEAIRGVRSAVMMGTQGGKKQVLLVSSAVPGDGKTTFTVNFAATLALAGHKVLLVDADLRRGNTHNYFKQPREGGLSEILAGEEHWDDMVKVTEVGTLSVITSGRLPANPGELLLSPILKQVIDEARGSYDYIIVDCPPLTAIDDAFSLVNFSDGLLFVVRAGQTSMRFAQAALAAVRQRGANLLGIVLNGITSDNPYYYYNTYYHSYYTKGADNQALSSARPGAKMPERRGRVAPDSISAKAKELSGESMSAAEGEADSKTEQYRKLRARRSGDTTTFRKKPEGDGAGE